MCVRAGWIPLSWRFTWFLHCFWINSYEHLQNLPNLFTILPKPPRLCCQVLRAVVRDLLDMGALDGRCDPSFAHGSSLTRGRRPLWDRARDKSNPSYTRPHPITAHKYAYSFQLPSSAGRYLSTCVPSPPMSSRFVIATHVGFARDRGGR